jgi:hypothetical protein
VLPRARSTGTPEKRRRTSASVGQVPALSELPTKEPTTPSMKATTSANGLLPQSSAGRGQLCRKKATLVIIIRNHVRHMQRMCETESNGRTARKAETTPGIPNHTRRGTAEMPMTSHIRQVRYHHRARSKLEMGTGEHP